MTRTSLFSALLVGALVACGSSNSSNPNPDAKVFKDAGGSGSNIGSGDELVVKNYLSWCSVSVGGAASATTGTQTVSVPAGKVALVAKAASATFEIGGNMWHHTDGDTGSGEPGTIAGTGATATSTASITVGSASTCVWVCCPFASGSGCPTADQCP